MLKPHKVLICKINSISFLLGFPPDSENFFEKKFSETFQKALMGLCALVFSGLSRTFLGRATAPTKITSRAETFFFPALTFIYFSYRTYLRNQSCNRCCRRRPVRLRSGQIPRRPCQRLHRLPAGSADKASQQADRTTFQALPYQP